MSSLWEAQFDTESAREEYEAEVRALLPTREMGRQAIEEVQSNYEEEMTRISVQEVVANGRHYEALNRSQREEDETQAWRQRHTDSTIYLEVG